MLCRYPSLEGPAFGAPRSLYTGEMHFLWAAAMRVDEDDISDLVILGAETSDDNDDDDLRQTQLIWLKGEGA